MLTCCANAKPNALLRAGVYSLEFSSSIAFCNSDINVSFVKPFLTRFANSSVISGTILFEQSNISTSNIARFPASVLSRSFYSKQCSQQ